MRSLRSPWGSPGARGLLVTGLMTLALIGPNVGGGSANGAAANSPGSSATGAAADTSTSSARGATAPTALSGTTPLAVAQGKATLLGPYNPAQVLRLVIGLQPPHLAAEQQFLRDLQTKHSPTFRHFLTPAEWIARFAPSAQDEQAVVDWAQANGLSITHRYPNRLLVDLEAPVSTIEKAFAVSINSYKIGAATHYSNDRDPLIPARLVGIVHSLEGLNDIEVMHPASPGLKEPASPVYSAGPAETTTAPLQANGNAKLLPARQQAASAHLRPHVTSQGDLRPNITGGAYDPTDIYSSQAYDYNALYGLGHCCNPLGNPNNSPAATSIAVATFGDQDPNDMAGFHNQYPYLAYRLVRIYIDGTPSCCDGEGTMDAQWSTAMANSFGCYCTTASVYVYEGANFNNGTFTDIYNQMVSDNNARVFTTSWSCTELSGCDSGTMDSRHAIFDMMLGLGWTLMAASGDRGAYDNCSNVSVSYPAADPDVLGAGGTTLTLNFDGTFNNEVAWSGNNCNANDGGSGGGCSAYYGTPSYQASANPCGTRNVPDLSLNADWLNAPQNYVFGGVLQGNGGTSIVAPELAGFYAQENAYLLADGSICGGSCGTVGQAQPGLYNAGTGGPVGFAPHNPFYDTLSGCNNNDIGSFGYCAGPGYDLVTGWGYANMLQLAWAYNWYVSSDSGQPTVTYSGPAVNTWYNSDQTVSWTIADTGGGGSPSGVAGYTPAWDVAPYDPGSHATPGCCDSFYDGPQVPNGTSGSLNLLSAGGDGCHTVHVLAWDNMGLSSGDQTYGPICLDTIPPYMTGISFSPASPSNATTITTLASASDPGCGTTGSCVSFIDYWVNTATDGSASGTWDYLGSSNGSSGSLTWNASSLADGNHLTAQIPCDVAGNCESYPSNDELAVYQIDRTPPHTTATVTGAPAGGGTYYAPVQVTLSASDNLSGVALTQYQIDGGALQTYSSPFQVVTVGTHTVGFFSTDHAGNVEPEQSVSFTIVAQPTNTPTNTPVPPTNTPTNTPVPPTNTPTNTPTKTPVPPTNTPTNTPTKTPVPPTNTPTNTATNTPTKTPVPPTNTPTKTPVPPTNTPTKTPVPPTNTPTRTPTNTPVPPTNTPTPPPPSIAVNPTKGHYAQPLTITGAHFGPSETVNVYEDNIPAPYYSATTAPDGSFNLSNTVRQGTLGLHTFTAVGQTSHRSAHTVFHVTPATFLWHTSGKAGSLNVLSGYGYGATETVKTYWQQKGGLLLGHSTTSTLGTFAASTAITYTTPLKSPGTYNIVTVGLTSGAIYTDTFTIHL